MLPLRKQVDYTEPEAIELVAEFLKHITIAKRNAMTFAEAAEDAVEELYNDQGHPTPDEFKAKLLEVVGNIKDFDEKLEEIRELAVEFRDGVGDTSYDPENGEQYKKDMAEKFIEDLECFKAEYGLLETLAEDELGDGSEPISKRRALSLLINFLIELGDYGENGMRFHQAVEQAYGKTQGVNRQINMELHASYCYQSMAFYFDRDDVALPGFAKFFREASVEEREHAEKLMKFQNQRGGRIVLQDIKKPDRDEWGTGLDAMQVAMALEKSVNQSLLDLHEVASTHNDGQMTDFLEGNYLQEQVKAIKEIGDYITNLKRVGPGLGEYMFDKETLGGESG
nr:hypothetical protein BaRGS_021439 [Batillaria attramentaria]